MARGYAKSRFPPALTSRVWPGAISSMDMDQRCVSGRVRVGIRRPAGRREPGRRGGCEEQVLAGTDFQGWPGLMSIMDLDPCQGGNPSPCREEGAGGGAAGAKSRFSPALTSRVGRD
jgi:hypothetical protein